MDSSREPPSPASPGPPSQASQAKRLALPPRRGRRCQAAPSGPRVQPPISLREALRSHREKEPPSGLLCRCGVFNISTMTIAIIFMKANKTKTKTERCAVLERPRLEKLTLPLASRGAKLLSQTGADWPLEDSRACASHSSVGPETSSRGSASLYLIQGSGVERNP